MGNSSIRQVKDTIKENRLQFCVKISWAVGAMSEAEAKQVETRYMELGQDINWIYNRNQIWNIFGILTPPEKEAWLDLKEKILNHANNTKAPLMCEYLFATILYCDKISDASFIFFTAPVQDLLEGIYRETRN